MQVHRDWLKKITYKPAHTHTTWPFCTACQSSKEDIQTSNWPKMNKKEKCEATLQKPKKPVLKTFSVGPNSLFTLLRERVRTDLKRLKNRLTRRCPNCSCLKLISQIVRMARCLGALVLPLDYTDRVII